MTGYVVTEVVTLAAFLALSLTSYLLMRNYFVRIFYGPEAKPTEAPFSFKLVLAITAIHLPIMLFGMLSIAIVGIRFILGA